MFSVFQPIFQNMLTSPFVNVLKTTDLSRSSTGSSNMTRMSKWAEGNYIQNLST
jgi:hypothetical protein